MAVNHAYAAYMKYARLRELASGRAELRAKTEMVPTAAEAAPPSAGTVSHEPTPR
jgi:hypothetical protein